MLTHLLRFSYCRGADHGEGGGLCSYRYFRVELLYVALDSLLFELTVKLLRADLLKGNSPARIRARGSPSHLFATAQPQGGTHGFEP